MILESLQTSRAEFERRTGWELKPEGACKGEFCVPLADAAASDPVDVRAISERLGMAIAQDEKSGAWAIGPETIGGRALHSAQAPELVLPDWRGHEFRLSSLRGQKVLLIAWASW